MTTTKSKGRCCARCGIARKPTKATSVLCTDCRYVLTEEERRAWTIKEAVAA